MSKKKADQTGVPQSEVRSAVKGMSFVELIRYKIDAWKKSREYRIRAGKAARTRSANMLGVSRDRRPLQINWGKVVRGAVLLLILIWILLAAIYLIGLVLDSPSGVPVAGPTETPIAKATAVPAAASTDVGEPAAVSGDEVVYLRVETLELDSVYNIWRRMPGVGIFLAPAGNRDQAVRQVTEELLTEDGFLVAVTTFEAQTGFYWVWVDEESLPAGCAVWVPRFAEDAQAGISATEDLLIDLVIYPGFNTSVVKFQIVCGMELTTAPTVGYTPPPGPTPTSPPENTPPPGPTLTPTQTPTPTEKVICNCETPTTPVPTPMEMEETATPSR